MLAVWLNANSKCKIQAEANDSHSSICFNVTHTHTHTYTLNEQCSAINVRSKESEWVSGKPTKYKSRHMETHWTSSDSQLGWVAFRAEPTTLPNLYDVNNIVHNTNSESCTIAGVVHCRNMNETDYHRLILNHGCPSFIHSFMFTSLASFNQILSFILF